MINSFFILNFLVQQFAIFFTGMAGNVPAVSQSGGFYTLLD